MLRLEDKETAEFRVGDLFDIFSIKQVPRGYNPKDYYGGEIPYITQTKNNNGITGFMVEDSGLKLNDGECIVLGVDNVINGVIYYQPSDFFANKVYGLRNIYINRKSAMFIITVFKKIYMGRYSYSDKISKKIIDETHLSLPVTSTGEPDWEWMEAYIRQIEELHVTRLKFHNDREAAILRELHPVADGEPEELDLDTKETAEFRVGDLFNVENLKAYHSSSVQNGDAIPYVTRKSVDNGLTSFSDTVPDEELNRKGLITVGAETAKFFYQPYESGFIAGNKMYSIHNENLSPKSSLFLISVLERKISGRFGFSHGLTGTRLKEEHINLPVTSYGEPDWDWMDAYICQIEERERANRRLSHRKEEAILAALASR